jgi:hypothetical protein
MADPPITPDQATILDQVANAQKNYNQTQIDYNNAVEKSASILDGFKSKLGAAGFSLNNLGKTAADNTGLFLGLGTAVIKAQDAFSGFKGIETSGINTFGRHVDDLGKKLLSGGTAGAVASKELESLKQKFLSMGGSPKLLTEAISKGSDATLSLLKNMFANADRALVAQSAFMQLSAATGNLGKVFEKTGNNLEQMNTLLDLQNDLMDQAKEATGSSDDEMNDYYYTLGKVPKALQEMVSSGTSAGGTMSMLTATIKLAHGTGRDFNKVVDDLHKSFRDYGLVGEQALTFTARISELSNKFGVELDDMRSGLLGATDAFKTLTNAGAAAHKMTESVSGIMGDYIQKLKDSGMTGQHAVEVVKNVTDSMAGLNIAQKAFVSAQTGGPGGLMGGFQIEKMLREGDIEGVQKKVMQTMQKQFGRVVTLDDATKSQAAASQLEKQILMLKQGPLGGMVKTDQDAYRFLESMRSGQTAKGPTGVAGLDPRGLQNSIDKGTSVEQKSDNKLAHISSEISAIRHRLETLSLGAVQKAFTGASLPQLEPLTDAQKANKEELSHQMRQATQKSGTNTAVVKSEMEQAGILKADRTKSNIESNVNNLSQSFGSIGNTMKSGMDTMKQMMSDPNSTLFNKAYSTRASTEMTPVSPGATLATAPKMAPGATLTTAPKMAPTAKSSTSAGPENTTLPEVRVTKEGDMGKINVDVVVKVRENGGQGRSVTPVSTP